MIFADAGYFIALSMSRDALHSRARGWSDVVTHERSLTSAFCEVFDKLWESLA